jgi:hypothetical protein
MDDVAVAFLRQYADVAIKAFWRARHDGAVESCLECAARDHNELGIRPEAHGVDLDSKAARRAGRRLAAEFAPGSLATDPDPETEEAVAA